MGIIFYILVGIVIIGILLLVIEYQYKASNIKVGDVYGVDVKDKNGKITPLYIKVSDVFTYKRMYYIEFRFLGHYKLSFTSNALYFLHKFYKV